jgi:hypothetical protein
MGQNFSVRGKLRGKRELTDKEKASKSLRFQGFLYGGEKGIRILLRVKKWDKFHNIPALKLSKINGLQTTQKNPVLAEKKLFGVNIGVNSILSIFDFLSQLVDRHIQRPTELFQLVKFEHLWPFPAVWKRLAGHSRSSGEFCIRLVGQGLGSPQGLDKLLMLVSA